MLDMHAKASARVDYIRVTKHAQLQNSRWLYVVLTDGRKEETSAMSTHEERCSRYSSLRLQPDGTRR
ncbi:hypothetical protein HanIR_Chr15g0769521 [Helianthus annuus]|nr:hypothetical protein HanIR_Chr15g0769521 [Helianthus annuus]